MFGMFPFMFNNTFNMINGLSNMFSGAFVDTVMNQVLENSSLSEFMDDIECENSRFNIELKEYEEGYLIKGRLPGVSPKDVDIDFQEDMITISVKNKRNYSNGSNIMVTIVNYGDDYVKKFPINKVDFSRMMVSFKESVLFMSLPKVKEVLEDTLSQDVIIDVDSYEVE